MQWVIRPQSEKHHDFRGFGGRVVGGVFRKGDEVMILPSGFTTRIKGIHEFENELEEAFSPMSVALTLEDEIDISRGDMIVKPNNKPHVDQDVEAMICWFSESTSLQTGRKYALLHTSKEVKAIVKDVRYKIDVNTLHKIEDDREMKLNDIGRIVLRTSSPLIHDSYTRNRLTGSFILVDEMTNNTVAAGMILGER